MVHGQEAAGGDAAHVDAVGVDAPGVAVLFHRFAEVPHGGPSVVDAAPNGANQLIFQVEQIGDPQSVGDAGHRIAHAGEVLAHRHHIHAVIGAGEEETAVGDDDQGAVGLAIVHRLVKVEVERRIGAERIDVAAVDIAL